MKILDKILNKNNDIKMDPSIITVDPKVKLLIPDFLDVCCLRWLFNYDDENGRIYVYKITIPNMPYLYARVQYTPSKHYSIRLFSYMGSDELNKDNLFKVKIGREQLNYVINDTEMKLFGPGNNYGFTYDLLWSKIIDEYWKCMDN